MADDLKRFTSLKLDMINAISTDTRLKMSDRVVAITMLRYADRSWRLYPSQVLLAALVGLKLRAMKGCIARLVKTGWLARERKNRQVTNLYTFSSGNVPLVTEKVNLIRDEIAALRGTNMPLSDQPEGHEYAPTMGTDLHLQRGTDLPPNTSGGTPEGNTSGFGATKEEALSTEGGDELAQRADQQRRSKQAHPAPVMVSSQPSVSEAMLGTKILQDAKRAAKVDPKTSLDALEAKQRGRL